MRIINKKIGLPTNTLQILLTTKEAENLVVKLDALLSLESKYDHCEVTDDERKHRLIVVVPEHNNIEELQSLGEWWTSGPIYPKDVTKL